MTFTMNQADTGPAWRPARAVTILAAGAVAAVLLCWPAAPAYALDRRSGDAVGVAAGQVVDDDVAATGRLVRIDGTVRGDVYAFGEQVAVTGIIEGDLIAVAREVLIDGQVQGDVRAAGATVQVNGRVDRNVTGAGQRLQLGNGGRVGGSWIGAGETISLAGDVGGSVAGAGESVLLQGDIRRGAEFAVGSLTLGPNARIGRGLTYWAERPQDVPAQAVAGAVQFHQMDRRHERVSRHDHGRFFGALSGFFSLTWLAGSALVGLALLRTCPRFVARFLNALERQPVSSFVVGTVGLVATVPLVVLLAVTIVGLPAAAVLAGGYAAGLYVGWLLLAVALGSILVGIVRRYGTRHMAWAFLLGLVVLHVGSRIPFLGVLVTFAALAFGFGTLLVALYRTWRRAELGPEPPAYLGGVGSVGA